MVVRKFYGNNTREALRQVRDALGPDALILSNRQMPGGGIEIMAVADTDVAVLTNTPASPVVNGHTHQGNVHLPDNYSSNGNYNATPTPVRTNGQRQNGYPETNQQNNEYARPDWPQVTRPRGRAPQTSYEDEPFLISHTRNGGSRESRPLEPAPSHPNSHPFTDARQNYPQQNYRSAEPSFEQNNYEEPVAPRNNGTRYVAPELFEEPQQRQPNRQSTQESNTETPNLATEAILQEVKMLRALVESQLAGFAWGDLTQHHPEKLEMLRRLLAAGFSPRLSRELLDRLPDNQTPDTAAKWIKNALFHNLKSTTPDNEIIDRGGIFALVGPTGVGKTTTVAKLAARFTLRYGPDEVALISTDSYRIGAHDQLRIYGKILNVPVVSVKDEDDLQLTLADLASKRLILIDTVGMSQRDQRVIEQTNMLAGRGLPISRILLLAANTHAATLDDVVRRYIGEQRQSLTHCILTKIDEATSLGASLDAMLRHRLTLCYVTNGQRVPEDLHLGNPLYLLDRAFKSLADGDTFQLKGDEYPLFMAAQPSSQQPESVSPSVRRNPREPLISASVLRSNRK
ncbi:flagellar biosynthesis protein FlhF [Leeia sp. TBRC 13508]|uniref:Flagellar biosynthesis protein FlhF n=1 Tax=Leeia speluncae TaxID=2884804 RepID=A0ABS8D6Q4_9NEIS|nr:flagellar biosynthesis protein FlhF [Leeia speluncae]MCB6183703.1 flagellar biosynthesis protein FlhF [Leeia speluncae]